MIYCIIEGCGRPVENKTTGLCASHAKIERDKRKKASLPKKEPYKIPSLSEKGKERLKEKQKAYRSMEAKGRYEYCGGCGTSSMLTHSHLLPVSQYAELEAVEENIVCDCVTCHNIWEHGNWEAIHKLKDIEFRLQRCDELNPLYLARRFYLKNPEILVNKGIKKE